MSSDGVAEYMLDSIIAAHKRISIDLAALAFELAARQPASVRSVADGPLIPVVITPPPSCPCCGAVDSGEL